MNASANTPDTVLGRTRVREVTGVFHSRAALDVAAGELLLMGFDRADVDVVAGPRGSWKRGGPPPVVSPGICGVRGAPAGPAQPPPNVANSLGWRCRCVHGCVLL